MGINKYPIQNTPENFVFQNAVTATGSGNTLSVGSFKTLVVEIFGTGTGTTIQFQGASVSGTYYPIAGTNLSTLATGSTTSTLGQLWKFDLTRLSTVEMNVTAITSGNVTIQGQIS